MLASFVIFILNTGILTAAQGIQDCAESYPSNWTGKYHGTMNTTVTGKTCKMWSDTHLSHYGHINNCLAPREDTVSSKGPWCYIEGGWEFCFVPLCNKDCRKSIHDKEYNGTLNITISGLHCWNWSLTSNLPSGGNPSYYHDETLNYCRTPSGDPESTPWCYTSSTTTRWERCNVSLCATICPDLNGSDLLIEPSILTGYQYNSVVTFKCKNGYMIHGPTAIRCTVDADQTFKGHWNATQPVCVRVECPPILIDHSKIQKSNIITRYPDMIHVQCDIGYQLNGNGSIQCTESGNWSNIPSCYGIKCPLITLEHSNILSRSIRFPETIQVKCNSGYQLNGSSSIQCTQSGNWSPLPTCDGSKCPLITLEHSNVLSRSIRFPETIQVKCNSGYQLNGSSSIQCTQSGNWSPLPTCDGSKCPLITLEHSNVLSRSIRFPETIQVKCNSGYQLNGSSSIQCTQSGNWSLLPTCDGVECEMITVEHLNISGLSGKKIRYPDSIHVDCDDGYELNGSSTIQCTKSGEWSNKPECVGDERSNPSEHSSGPGAAIGGGITAAVLAIVIVIIVVIFIKRQRGSKTKEEPTPYKQPNINKHENNEYSEIRLSGLELVGDHHDPLPAINISGKNRTYNNEPDEDGGYYDFTEGPQMSKSAIPVKEFYIYVDNGRGKGGKLEAEFLKLKTGLQYPTTAALKPGNKIKNKYKNLFAYDETRVVLNTNLQLTSDYINASYINGYGRLKQYIAAQGPQDNTVNEFWQMVWQVDCGKIVMLTKVFEEAKQKCNHYWPEAVGKSNDFDGIVVTLMKEDIYSDFTIRHIKLQRERTRKTVIQFHFTAWPDKDVPKYSSSLVHFRQKVNSKENSAKGPVIVHCSAGIGRTGTYIALDYAVTEAKEVGYVDVFRCVETLRRQRVNMVQTARQYVFLHDAVLEALVCPYTGTPTKDFPGVYKDLLKFDSTKKKHKLHIEYDLMTSLSQKHDEDDFDKGKNVENKKKNRYTNIIPVESEMPRLISPVEGHNEYINAVFLPGYKSSRAFVVTQMPMENTVIDFWRLVYDYGISVIVMLNTDHEEKDVYWPKQKDDKLDLGPFEIKQKNLTRKKYYVMMELCLTSNQEQKRVTLFQQIFWNDGDTVPGDIEDFFALITDIEEARGRESGEGPLLVHCLNGCDKSGLYCVMSTIIEKMRIEQDVDINHTIKQMRNRRPQIISNYEQYRFLYEAVIEYLKQFETYANFS